MAIREIHSSKPHYFYCIYENMSEDTKLVLTRTILYKYSQPSQLTSKLLANTYPILQLSRLLLPCTIPRMNSLYLNGIHASKTV